MSELFQASIDAMRGAVGEGADGERLVDEIGMVRAETLMAGYDARYADDVLGPNRRHDVIAVEVEFVGPLVNPTTHADSRTWLLGGKIDLILRDVDTRRIYVGEHKTSGEDLSDGSDYWARLTLDPQISNYLVGARRLAPTLGYEPNDVAGVIYDVIAKPLQRPHAATPVEARKYTKSTKNEPSRLYAGQREFDETLAEYQERIVGVIEKEPDKFYARREVVRLENDVREAAIDIWQAGTQIRDARRLSVWPRNPDACLLYGRRCSYFDVCLGMAHVEDTARFRRAERAHEELGADDNKRRLPLLTTSAVKSYRSCPRKYLLAYEQGYRSVRADENLRFGTLIHTGLEAWWRAAQEAQRADSSPQSTQNTAA